MSTCDWFKGFHSALLSKQFRCLKILLLPSCLLWSLCNRLSPFSRIDRRKCMPVHNLLQYRNCVLFKPTSVGDLRLAVGLCFSSAEAQAHDPFCHPHTGDGIGGTRKLFNSCSKIWWVLSVKVLSPPRQSCTIRVVVWGLFLPLCGKRSQGAELQGWGAKWRSNC